MFNPNNSLEGGGINHNNSSNSGRGSMHSNSSGAFSGRGMTNNNNSVIPMVSRSSNDEMLDDYSGRMSNPRRLSTNDEMLNEREFKLLQQQQLLQQQHLEQQELEIYERQLMQKELEQQQLLQRLQQQQEHLQQQQQLLLLRKQQYHHQKQQQQFLQQQQQQGMFSPQQQQLPDARQQSMQFQNNNFVNTQQISDIDDALYLRQQQQLELQQQQEQILRMSQQDQLQMSQGQREQWLMKQQQIEQQIQHQQQQLLLQQQQLQEQFPVRGDSGRNFAGLQDPAQQFPSNVPSNSPLPSNATNNNNNNVRIPSSLSAPLEQSNTQHPGANISGPKIPVFTPTSTENPNDIYVPPDYEPSDLDICSGRGKAFWNHNGNVAFRNLIQSQVDTYINAPTKAEKSAIVVAIVDELRRKGCKFLKQATNEQGQLVWYDIGDGQARDKVGHSLRDQVTAINRSQREGGSRSPVPRGSASPKPSASSMPSSQSVSPKRATPTISPKPIPVGSSSSVAPTNDLPGNLNLPGPQVPQYYKNDGNNAPSVNLLPMTNESLLRMQQQQQNQAYLYNNSDMDHEMQQNQFDDDDDQQRRPSISVSDSGNEAEMRRSILDTSTLMVEFGRRPSFVVESLTSEGSNLNMNLQYEDIEKDLNASHSSLKRESTSQQRSAFLFEEDDLPVVFPKKQATQQLMTRTNTGHSLSMRDRNSSNKKAGITSSNNTNDLITNSIQTIDTTFGDRSILTPNRAVGIGSGTGTSMLMSGGSTVRMNSSIMRNSTMRFSEVSLMSAGFENMSIMNQNSDSSLNHFASLDDSKRFEI